MPCHQLTSFNLSKSRHRIDLFARYVVPIDTLAKRGRFLPDISTVLQKPATSSRG